MFPACRIRKRGEKRHEGQGRREAFLATGEGKPLKVEAHGRYPHETRREGFRAEQGVKRLRKSEGAAQPGQVNLVLVAARFLKRRRARKPHGRQLATECVVRDCTKRWAICSGRSLNVKGKGMRGWRIRFIVCALPAAGNHEVRGLLDPSSRWEHSTDTGARSAVSDTLKSVPRR
jgi:hypothetical protein